MSYSSFRSERRGVSFAKFVLTLLVGVVLAACPAVIALAEEAKGNVATGGSSYSLGQEVYFGSFFQSKVTDEAQLERIRNEADFENDIATLSGVRIARKGSNYFIEEPICWRVLASDGGTVTLISDKALDVRAFSSWEHFWDTSDLRAWLNGDFVDLAFSAEDQGDLREVTNTFLMQTYDDWRTRQDGEYVSTEDRVSLPYVDDINAGLLSNAGVSAVAYTTPYADTSEAASRWWLLGKGSWYYGNMQNNYVTATGTVSSYYPTYSYGVRPMITVNADAAGLSSERPASGGEYDEVQFPTVDATSISGEFRFRTDLNPSESMAYGFNYDDNWLFSRNDADKYSLLKMSVRVSMAAYGVRFDVASRNITDLMDSLGFVHTEDSVCYPIPTQETIGYAIGMKNIKRADGSEGSIILVAIRGGGYGEEWGGNFKVGVMNREHQGFREASLAVQNGLVDFYKKHRGQVKENSVVWICGYSRAAATANLLAAHLIDGQPIEGIGEDNVKAFCFECPLNTELSRKDATNARYNGIVSIVNPIDFVPKVAPRGWGFTRYGMTYYIPSRETTFFYDALKTRMILAYEDLYDYNGRSYSDKYHTEGAGQAYILDGCFDALSKVVSRSREVLPWYNPKNLLWSYVEDIEDDARDIAANLLGSDQGYKENLSTLIKALAERIPALAGLNRCIETAMIVPCVPTAHYPELCLSWIDSLNGFGSYKTSQTNKYLKIFVNCPVDITVRDSSGTTVGRIVDDTPGEGDQVVTLVDENGQKVVVLPMGEQFEVDLEATGSGAVTYAVAEYDADAGDTTRVVSYVNVTVTEGDVLVGGVEPGEDGNEGVYTLSGTDGVPLDPDTDVTGSEAAECAVVATAGDGGSVEGGGSFVTDSYCLLKAETDGGHEFSGWYEDNELVSDEEEWRFRVERDTKVEARFKKAESLEAPFFADATPGDDANHGTEVDWMGRSGISTGWEQKDGTRLYKGLDSVKRCDFAAFLYRLYDLSDDGERNDSPKLADAEVTEVLAGVSDCDPDGTYHAMEVAWMISSGISRGWQDKGKDTVSFRPMANVARQDMAAFLYRFADVLDDGEQNGTLAMGPETVTFSDVEHGDAVNHAPEVEWLASVGVTKGWGMKDGTYQFRGTRTVARQDMAAFMYRLYGYLNQ